MARTPDDVARPPALGGTARRPPPATRHPPPATHTPHATRHPPPATRHSPRRASGARTVIILGPVDLRSVW